MSVILVLQRRQLTVYQASGGQTGCTESFLNNNAGVEKFRQFLLGNQSAQFLVLLDLEDEQLNLQSIPRVARRDKKAMLRHQRNKLYGDCHFASAVIVDHKDRPESRISVTQIGLLPDAPDCVWLTLLEEANVCIRSFHWMSLLISSLIKTIGADSAISIFLVRMEAMDDRILVFRDQQPLISRRIADQYGGAMDGSTLDIDATSSVLSDQVIQTIAYLQRLVESGEVDLPIADDLRVVALGNYTAVDIESVNTKLLVAGVSPLHLVPRESLPKEFLAQNKRAPILKPVADTSQEICELIARSVSNRKAFSYSLIFHSVKFLQRKFRHGLYAISVSLLAGSAVASVATHYVVSDLTGLEEYTKKLEDDTIRAKQARPHPDWSISYSMDGIREATAQIGLLEFSNQSTPFHFLVLVSEQLTNHSGIELTSIQWVDVDRVLPADGFDGISVDTAMSRFSAIVTGRIKLDANGFTLAMKEFRSFVASIRQSVNEFTPDSNVTVVTLPFSGAKPVALNTGPISGEFRLEVGSSE